MAEYTYKDIIIDPTSEEAKNAVGEGCYFGSNPKTVLDFANCNEKKFLRVLECIKPEEDNPFYDYKYGFPCIIVKKEEPKKYVPFENADEFIDAYDSANYSVKNRTVENKLLNYGGIWLKHRESDDFFMVLEIRDDGVIIRRNLFTTSWNDLSNDYTFLDGSPCGKPMEE